MPQRLPSGATDALVSIRARPRGRAMQSGREPEIFASFVSIRARPRGRAMRGRSAYSRMSARQFQSAPGLEAGRCSMASLMVLEEMRFNPRPA